MEPLELELGARQHSTARQANKPLSLHYQRVFFFLSWDESAHWNTDNLGTWHLYKQRVTSAGANYPYIDRWFPLKHGVSLVAMENGPLIDHQLIKSIKYYFTYQTWWFSICWKTGWSSSPFVDPTFGRGTTRSQQQKQKCGSSCDGTWQIRLKWRFSNGEKWKTSINGGYSDVQLPCFSIMKWLDCGKRINME